MLVVTQFSSFTYLIDHVLMYSKCKLKIVEDVLFFLAKLLKIGTNVLIESICNLNQYAYAYANQD